MKLFGNKNKVLVIAILACFIIMVKIEWPLLNNALKGKEKDFNDKLFYVVASFEEKLMRDSLLMNSINSDSGIINLLQHEIKFKVDSVFSSSKIPIDYVFAAGRVKNEAVTYQEIGKLNKGFIQDNLIWSGDPKNNVEIINTKVKIGYLGPPGKKIYYIKIFFPNKKHYLILSLLPQFLTMAVALLMLFICFLLLLAVIRKQNVMAQSKNDFISNMTHELKTPLFTISIATKMLAEQEIIKANNKFVGYLETIREEAVRLLHLADRVMESSEINKKTIDLEKEKVDVHPILRNAVNRLELIRKEHNSNIAMNLLASQHYLHGNAKHLENVFVNIIDNGIKYSAAGSGIVIDTKDDGTEMFISITDKGIGIDDSIKELIFERFFRAHTGNVHDTKGYGIGLSFARSVIEAHGGRIRLNSLVGKGSTFIITLPLIKQ